MLADALKDEADILLDMVADNGCTLADSVMELDVAGYRGSDRFEREKTALFRNYPQFVGPSSLLPNAGDYYAFDDTGIPMIVIRKADGSLSAFLNACSHRGAPLGEGCGQAKGGRLLTCPYHAWSYTLDGELNGVPYGERGRVLLTTLTKEFFMPRFAERDEGERAAPIDIYPLSMPVNSCY